jgi:hypothetical protein
MWVKFKPVIEMYRGTDFTGHDYENFEYVAGQLNEFQRKKYGSTITGRIENDFPKRVDAQRTP